MSNEDRKGIVFWFTGLSGSGKSTVADEVYKKLIKSKVDCERLDGDTIRDNLNEQLGFTKEGRDRNIEIAGFVSKMLVDHGVVVLSSFISPYHQHRESLQKKIDNFVEVFVNAPLDICERRDVKGLYKKARSGEIKNFTGIDDPYEKPEDPDIILNTADESIEESVEKIISFLKSKNFLD